MKFPYILFQFFSLFYTTEAFGGKEYASYSELDLSSCTSKKIQVIQQEVEDDRDQIIALGLNHPKTTNEIFRELTKALDPSLFTQLKLLDISDTKINEHAAPTLAAWLDIESLLFIKMTGTPVSLRHIVNLRQKFKSLFPSKADQFMERIIFVSRDYIRKASTTVQVYKDYVTSGIIPSNWAVTHDAFYKNSIYKSLMNKKITNQNQLILRKLQLYSLESETFSKSKVTKEQNEDRGEDGISNVDVDIVQSLQSLTLEEK